MRERALGVQAGLTSVANEVVVLVMVGGAGSTAALGLRWPAGSSSWPGTMSTDPRQPSLGWSDVRPHASNLVLVTVVTQGAVGLEKSRAAAGRERRRRVDDCRQQWGECFHPPLACSKDTISSFVLNEESKFLLCSSRCSCAQKRSQYVPLKIICRIELYLIFVKDNIITGFPYCPA
jgi:hypothetical protein